MKITEIEVHEITLEYEDFLAYQLNHYYGPIRRTVYVVHTDTGLEGLGESGRPEPQMRYTSPISTTYWDDDGTSEYRTTFERIEREGVVLESGV